MPIATEDIATFISLFEDATGVVLVQPGTNDAPHWMREISQKMLAADTSHELVPSALRQSFQLATDVAISEPASDTPTGWMLEISNKMLAADNEHAVAPEALRQSFEVLTGIALAEPTDDTPARWAFRLLSAIFGDNLASTFVSPVRLLVQKQLAKASASQGDVGGESYTKGVS